MAQLCLAAHTDGEFGDFCTKTCTDDASCGTGATCVGGSNGYSICIPSGCTLVASDAGAPDAGASL
jgi:hypothetical protein